MVNPSSDRQRGAQPVTTHLRWIFIPAGVLFLFDWAGCNIPRHAMVAHLPLVGPPRHLRDIWWHLPAFLGLLLFLHAQSLRRRARLDAEKDAPEDNDDDKPITLGL